MNDLSSVWNIYFKILTDKINKIMKFMKFFYSWLVQ